MTPGSSPKLCSTKLDYYGARFSVALEKYAELTGNIKPIASSPFLYVYWYRRSTVSQSLSSIALSISIALSMND